MYDDNRPNNKCIDCNFYEDGDDCDRYFCGLDEQNRTIFLEDDETPTWCKILNKE